MKKTILSIFLSVLALSLLFSGCTQLQTQQGTATFKETENFNPEVPISADNFKTEEEFNAFLKENDGSTSYYGGGILRSAMESADMAVGGAMEKAVSNVAPSADYSQTNNQVSAVDEADIIKTDGEYIYTITGSTLYIIKAYPGEEAEVVSKINLESAPQSIFVNGDNLAVFGNFYDLDYFKKIDYRPRNGMTYFTIYDISDKENPEIVRDYKFEGYYFQARMTGDFVYFVTISGMQYGGPYPTPLIIEDDVARSMPVQDIYFYPIPYNYPQLANIHAISLKGMSDPVESKSLAIEGGAGMYMSENNIYITYTEYINEWEIREDIVKELVLPKLSDFDKALIEKIKNTDNEVLSQYEKDAKIMQIIYDYTTYMSEDERDAFETEADKKLREELDKYDYFEYTIINKISAENGEIGVKSSGKVPGHVINQFSMDEYKGVLRVATTLSQRWMPVYYSKQVDEPIPVDIGGGIATEPAEASSGSGGAAETGIAKIVAPEIMPRNDFTESSSNVFTLNKDMEVMDSVTGIAEGEQIYSTRFMGDRLYMVTFKQVDPFFVIDLSDPEDIKMLGELKIPGFSRYLHPYDENTIIGIGREATETGRTQGLKISLFDISDVENPKEIAKYVTDEKYAQSTAEYEHKAFLFSKEKEILVIPAYSYNYDYMTGKSGQDYNGAMVFKITKDEITLRGIIDHSKGQSGYYYSPTVERSLYIEELIYTKSPTLLRINKISDLTNVKNIELTGSDGPIPIY